MNNPKLQNDIEKMKSEYNGISLSVSEKENMKANIFERIETSPAPDRAPVRSPFFNWSFYAKAASVSFATFVLVTSPVAFAAQRSLPGEFLYPIKTKVNESVVEVFIPQEEREDYHKSLLAKRAFEIKTLSKEGELKEEQINDVEVAIENSVEAVISVSDISDETEEEIIQDHKDVIAVLEFSENIIENKKALETESKIGEIKITAESSLDEHIEKISNSEDGVDDSVDELIREAKEIIKDIPEEDKEEFNDEVDKIENTRDDTVVIKMDVEPSDNTTFSAKAVGSVEIGGEVMTDKKLNMVLDLHEQISEKRVELEIEKLENSVNIAF